MEPERQEPCLSYPDIPTSIRFLRAKMIQTGYFKHCVLSFVCANGYSSSYSALKLAIFEYVLAVV